MNNIVAIVGRPNVGKSTLYNRLTGSRSAIVDNASGVTRDRHYCVAEWVGKEFMLIDTGGYVHGSKDVFEQAIRKQVEIAIAEATMILFLVDVTVGITIEEENIAKLLRNSKKPVFVVANKVDSNKLNYASAVFYKFGLGEEVYDVSSMTGTGTGELLDNMVAKFLPEEPEETCSLAKIAIIGRPNVGKSSLVNTLLGSQRNIVTPIAGTTRDSIYTTYKQFGNNCTLIDTAGLRKKAKVNENIEFYSAMRAIRALETADVCLLLIDAKEGFQAQDLNILQLTEKNKKGIVVVVNKWDLIAKDQKTASSIEAKIREKITPFSDVPILFTSVTEKQRIFDAMKKVNQVFENRRKKVRTSELNDVMLKVIEKNPPPATKGKHIKIKYITQLPGVAPIFAFFCNLPQYIRLPYKRFLENKLREEFNFTGVPITLYFRKK